MASRLPLLHRRPDQVFFFVRSSIAFKVHQDRQSETDTVSWDKGCACVLVGSAKPVAVIRSPKQGDDRERAFDLNLRRYNRIEKGHTLKPGAKSSDV